MSNNLYKLPNVIFISETWFTPNEVNCNIDQYHAYPLMRTCKSGVGSVFIYVHDSLVSVMISCNFKPVTFEYVASHACCKLNLGKYVFVCIDRQALVIQFLSMN